MKKVQKYKIGSIFRKMPIFEIRVMAYSEGYYMVRCKGFYPSIMSEKELDLLPQIK